MPKIRRWFNVSHDINSDPEIWELVGLFEARGLMAWLELLSIADRNSGYIPGTEARLIKALAIKLNTTAEKISRILGWVVALGWIHRRPLDDTSTTAPGPLDDTSTTPRRHLHDGSWSNRDAFARTRNYATYHTTWESKRNSKPPLLSSPLLTSPLPQKEEVKKDHKNDPKKAPALPAVVVKVELPEWLDPEVWEAYRQHRAAMPKKSRMTTNAEKLAMAQLAKWHVAGHDPNEIVRTSVMNGWIGLFEPRSGLHSIKGGQHHGKAEPKGFAAIREILARENKP